MQTVSIGFFTLKWWAVAACHLFPIAALMAAPPLPTLPPRSFKLAPKQPTFKASAARLTEHQWRYGLPVGTVPSNYWWNLEHSFDGKRWTVLLSNVSVIPILQTTNRQEFFRLAGRP